jgi:emfourin
MSQPVHVRFRRSGGLAGITIGVDTDTDTNELSPAHTETIRALLSGPDSPPASAPGAPDRFSYELQIDDGRCRRVLRWQESEIPDLIRPLIAELSSRSRPIS